MKRIHSLFAVLFTVAAVLAASTPASAAIPKTVQLKWRTSAVSVAGFVDSSTASINGAIGTTGTIDTTTFISTGDFDWAAMGGASPATINGCMRILFTGTADDTDTLFVAVEGSVDGVNPTSSTTFLTINGTATVYDRNIAGPITCDSDALVNSAGGNVWLQPYLRFRVRADGNTAATFLNARVYLRYLSRGQ